MPRTIAKTQMTYTIADGDLVQTTAFVQRRCSKQAFDTVAAAVQDARLRGGVTLAEIARSTELPPAQVRVAISFLHERNVIESHDHRWLPVGEDATLDALVEYFVLEQRSKKR